MSEVQIKAVRQYGNWVYYPLCDKAKLFAQIAGTRTITPLVVTAIKRLGFELKIVLDQPEERVL